MKAYNEYQNCIDACLKSASLSNFCAAACTREQDIAMLAECIRLNMECAAVCYNAAQLMSMGSHKIKEICSICAYMCEQCASECGKHSHEHCQRCAQACYKCAEECRAMAVGMAA